MEVLTSGVTMKRYKAFTENKRRIEQLRPFIAYEYHHKNKTSSELSQKYKVSQGAVRNAKDNFFRNEVKGLMGEGESVLIVESRSIEEAYRVLKNADIKCRYAHKDHELIESYESKINV